MGRWGVKTLKGSCTSNQTTSYVFFTISISNSYRLNRPNDFTWNPLTYASRHQNCYNDEFASHVRKKRLEYVLKVKLL